MVFENECEKKRQKELLDNVEVRSEGLLPPGKNTDVLLGMTTWEVVAGSLSLGVRTQSTRECDVEV